MNGADGPESLEKVSLNDETTRKHSAGEITIGGVNFSRFDWLSDT